MKCLKTNRFRSSWKCQSNWIVACVYTDTHTHTHPTIDMGGICIIFRVALQWNTMVFGCYLKYWQTIFTKNCRQQELKYSSNLILGNVSSFIVYFFYIGMEKLYRLRASEKEREKGRQRERERNKEKEREKERIKEKNLKAHRVKDNKVTENILSRRQKSKYDKMDK